MIEDICRSCSPTAQKGTINVKSEQDATTIATPETCDDEVFIDASTAFAHGTTDKTDWNIYIGS